MRVKRDRVGLVDSLQNPPTVLGKHEDTAVGAIDMDPGAVAMGKVHDFPNRIDGAGVRRSGICYDEEWRLRRSSQRQ